MPRVSNDPMPFYRFYLQGESPTPSDGAGLGDDRAALIYAYRYLAPGGTVSIWDGGRHVGQLWGEQPQASRAPPRFEIAARNDRACAGPPARLRGGM